MTAMSHIFVRLLRDDQLQSQIGQKQAFGVTSFELLVSFYPAL